MFAHNDASSEYEDAKILKSIILINLDRDAYRLEWMAKQFERQGIKFVRHKALTGDDTRKLFPRRFSNCKLKPGETGCWGSHIQIAEKIATGAYPSPALILEDDVLIPENLTSLMSELLKTLPQNWDIVRLSNKPKRKVKLISQLPAPHNEFEIVRYSRIPNGTGALLLNTRGAQKIGKINPEILAIDQHIGKPWLTNMETYGVVPIPFLQNQLESSINHMPETSSSPSRLNPNGTRRMFFYMSKFRFYIPYFTKKLFPLSRA